MTNGTMIIRFPPIDVARGGDVMRRVMIGFERLWVSGRLRPLIESTEGRETVAAFEAARIEVERQLGEAVARSEAATALTIGLPAETAADVLRFVRRFIHLMTDTKAMGAVGAEPLDQNDLDFVESYIAHGEGEVSRHWAAKRAAT